MQNKMPYRHDFVVSKKVLYSCQMFLCIVLREKRERERNEVVKVLHVNVNFLFTFNFNQIWTFFVDMKRKEIHFF